jgi:DNA polymerase III delta prime subunit
MNNQLCYHPEIKEKLNFFLKSNDIPNIIFHGKSGNGKRTIVHNFINDIYNNNKELLKNYVMYVNCAHGKGIKFIRDELKFFAKTHMNIEGTSKFKTIVLSNADELTIDAQSALRRCIELFSHTTRFFIIIENKYKLLKPILSRFCELYVYEPKIKDKVFNFHKHIIENTFFITKRKEKTNHNFFDKLFNDFNSANSSDDNANDNATNDNANDNATSSDDNTIINLTTLTHNLYEKGYSGLDIINYLENSDRFAPINKYQMILLFNKVKNDFRNEKLFILFILNFILLRSDYDLENISFM